MQLHFLLGMCSQEPGNRSNVGMAVQSIRTTKHVLEQRNASVLVHVLLVCVCIFFPKLFFLFSYILVNQTRGQEVKH